MTNKEIDRLAEYLARDAEMQHKLQAPTPQKRREDPPVIEPFAIFWLSIYLRLWPLFLLFCFLNRIHTDP